MEGDGGNISYQNAAPSAAAATSTSSSRAAAHDDFPKLSWRTKLGYGMGHILNDLCASMWFTYLLLFFHKVLLFDNVSAGIVLFLGQIADGLATTFVGYFSDKGDALFLCNRFGKRKAWHIIGTVCVLTSFPFVFLRSIDFDSTHVFAKLVYYAAFVVIFQFGWAAVQISHLSMIPDITPCKHERTGLTAIRYAMTVAANITVYLITWGFLGQGNADGMVGPEDADAFRNIMLVAVAIGACSSGLFYLFVRVENNEENRLNGEDGDSDEDRGEGEGEPQRPRVIRRMNVADWFREPNFYQVAGLYMSTRLFVNLSQAYIPLFLQISLRLNASYVAIIPLVMFIFGLVTSSVMKFCNRRVGRSWTFAMGCMFAIGGAIWIKAGFPIDATNFATSANSSSTIFGVAAFVGAGGSTMLITSLSLTADLIARNSESGAFVYGAMSLSDKVSNGVAVVVIQHLIPGDTDTCINCRFYFQNVLFYVCGGAAFCGFLFMLSLVPFKLGERWRDRQPRTVGVSGEGYESLPGDDSEPQQAVSGPRRRQQHGDSDGDESARLIN